MEIGAATNKVSQSVKGKSSHAEGHILQQKECAAARLEE